MIQRLKRIKSLEEYFGYNLGNQIFIPSFRVFLCDGNFHLHFRLHFLSNFRGKREKTFSPRRWSPRVETNPFSRFSAHVDFRLGKSSFEQIFIKNIFSDKANSAVGIFEDDSF